MSTEISTLSAQVGTVTHVVSNLLAWLAHRRPGIVWIEFLSDEIRDRAIEQVNANCRTAKTPVRRVEMHSAFSRRDWEQVRDQIESAVGVVNVLFPALFNQDSLEPLSFRDFALALNLDRERIFSADALQIWWISRPLSAILRPLAPDFVSWVHARFTLSELPPSAATGTSHLELVTQIDRGVDSASISLQHRSPEASQHVTDGDPRLVEPHELLRQSEQLLTAGKLKEALAVAGEAVYGFRQESSIGEAAQGGLAAALDLLARIQARLGQRQQALASSAEAVRHYRALAEANADVFLPDLARSLNNLSNRQGAMGRRAEALASVAEAVRHYRALADAKRDDFLPDLAGSLNNQATAQRDMGQLTEALASIAEAVHHYRALAQANPDAFMPGLAMSLNNQANMQSDMGQRAEALASIFESVSHYRALAQANPDAFMPGLAMSLNNQANMQSDMGQRAEAFASIAEAVRHYRALAEANPAAFLPELAASLNNQASMHRDMGQHPEALATIADVVRLRRALAGASPSAFLPGLAMSLNNQAAMQSATGQRAEALASIAESVRYYRALAHANPDAFIPNLVTSLNNQAATQNDMGQRAEALASIAEAVRLRRALAQSNPDAFLPDLARSLGLQGEILASLDRPSEAREAAREALVCLTPFIERYPGVFDSLAKIALHDYLLCTRSLGDEPEEKLLLPYLNLLKTESPGSPATPPKKDHSQI